MCSSSPMELIIMDSIDVHRCISPRAYEHLESGNHFAIFMVLGIWHELHAWLIVGPEEMLMR